MPLTPKERKAVDTQIEERDTRRANREHNRAEIANLKILRLKETDSVKRIQLLRLISDGTEMMLKQTKRLGELTCPSIAKRLGVALSSVRYRETVYQRSGIQGLSLTQQRKIEGAIVKSRENDSNSELSVWLGKNG